MEEDLSPFIARATVGAGFEIPDILRPMEFQMPQDGFVGRLRKQGFDRQHQTHSTVLAACLRLVSRRFYRGIVSTTAKKSGPPAIASGPGDESGLYFP